MKAYWLILDSPYFASTRYRRQGAKFPDQELPLRRGGCRVGDVVRVAGSVTPGAGEEVTIKADDTTAKSFTIDPGKILPAK